MTRPLAVLGAAALAAACVQTTGGQLVDFPVAAAGRADLAEGQPFHFVAEDGWDIVLTKAVLHVGAVYLDSAAPVSGAQDTPCILPGTYVAEMSGALDPSGRAGMDVDLLSPRPQRFGALGHGTTARAVAGQLWLTGIAGDIDTPDDATRILVVEGTAHKGADSWPFGGQITIGTNRAASSSLAGASPICRERVVTILTDTSVAASGGLLVRIDVQKLFTNVDWARIPVSSSAHQFVDQPDADQPSRNLYANLHAGSGAGSPYSFSWEPDL